MCGERGGGGGGGGMLEKQMLPSLKMNSIILLLFTLNVVFLCAAAYTYIHTESSACCGAIYMELYMCALATTIGMYIEAVDV